MTPETKWQEIVDFLTGSSSSLDNALAVFGAEDLQDHDPFLVTLDEQIFLCDTCGWWCLSEEQNCMVDLICNDCWDEALESLNKEE
jgi:hypothetical protein